MMFLGALFTVIGLGAVAYLLGWRPEDLHSSGLAPHKSALDILKERYARGEITREEYQSMREELEH